MDVVHRSCAGLDVHKRSVMACVRRTADSGKVHSHLKQFGTMTRDLLELRDWLASHRVSHVAMESTGVFWKPIYHILEDRFEVLLVNAQHLKNVPGRKTDVKDSEWIAQLLQVGLLRASFIPPKPLRDLRDLNRHRAQCSQDRTRIANRIHKILQDANVKLSSVASDILGVSGRSMLRAIINGEDDPEVLAEMARGRMRNRIPELKLALHGKVTAHHRFMLETLREQLRSIEGTIDRLAGRIDEVMAEADDTQDGPDALSFQQSTLLLETIPGVSSLAAHTILAETGTDMSQFPSAAHLCSWAGISSGNSESAGKRKTGKTPKGNRWLRRILVQVALSASRSKDTYLSSQYRRLASRRGRKRAAVAVAHTILTVVYHMLSRRETYQDLGPEYLDQLDPGRLTKYLVRRLERLGHKVHLEPAA